MTTVAGCVALADATDPAAFGGKAVQLGSAVRAGLPVPRGIALSWATVAALCAGEDLHAEVTAQFAESLLAVRSSAVGEDSGAASFAGAHETKLGVPAGQVVPAVRQVGASAATAGAAAYRERLGLGGAARMGVVVQELVDADVAGVMFTRNPLTGVAERVVEASWGLGEAVVAGLVTPDRFVMSADGALREVAAGEKDVALRCGPGGVFSQRVDDELIERLCLDEGRLGALHELAALCDRVYGSPDHDIEFAFCGEVVHLLQRRPITHA